MKQIYMVIGCPGSGKSWVCEQLTNEFHYVRHDDHLTGYVGAITRQMQIATKPVLAETPFSISQIKNPLEASGFNVTPVFIQELPDVIRDRYRKRGSGELPDGHLTRQTTYMARALEWQSFHGTSAQVLAYLKNAAPKQPEKFPWQ